MRILLSNDDGIHSPGIKLLAKTFSPEDEIIIAAPASERSTASHTLTLHKPVRIVQLEGTKNAYAISGFPADCVHLALKQIFKNNPPDLILSGINRGGNLGHDVFYSGTIAAAREGCIQNVPGIAVSINFNTTRIDEIRKQTIYWETAADFTKQFVKTILSHKLPPNYLFNINIPNLPKARIKGWKYTKQGVRIYSGDIIVRSDPRGYKYSWLGGYYGGFKDIKGSDCNAINEDYISVTPLSIDLTDYDMLNKIKSWKIDWS